MLTHTHTHTHTNTHTHMQAQVLEDPAAMLGRIDFSLPNVLTPEDSICLFT